MEERERERDERFKFGTKRAPPPPAHSPQGAVRVFGLRSERITPRQDELDPRHRRSSYKLLYGTGPKSSLAANSGGHCSTNTGCMLITSSQNHSAALSKLRER